MLLSNSARLGCKGLFDFWEIFQRSISASMRHRMYSDIEMPCLSDCASTHSRISSFSRSFNVCSFLSDVGLPVLIVSFQYFYNFLTAAVLSGKPILLSSSKVFMLTSYVVQKWHLSLCVGVTCHQAAPGLNPPAGCLSVVASGGSAWLLCACSVNCVYIQHN